jgi:hypothetical protein
VARQFLSSRVRLESLVGKSCWRVELGLI